MKDRSKDTFFGMNRSFPAHKGIPKEHYSGCSVGKYWRRQHNKKCRQFNKMYDIDKSRLY